MHHDSAAPRTEDAGVIGRLLRTLAKHIATSFTNSPAHTQKPVTDQHHDIPTALIIPSTFHPATAETSQQLPIMSSLCGYHRTLPSVNATSNTKQYQQHTV